MKLKWSFWAVLGIFILVFSLRIFISLQTNAFSDDHSYFTLRQIENIAETGKPIINDDLSYGGRTLFFSPVFYYLLTIISLIFKNIISLKIFINLLASTVVIASYLIGFELTKSKRIGTLTAFLSGFIPLFFAESLNSLSIYSITLPLMFFCIYFLMLLNKDKKYYPYFLFFIITFIIISPISIIIVLGMILFLILSRLEKIEISKANTELIIVSLFFYLWFYFLIFKKAILFHGPKIIWQNIPKIYLTQYFSEITIIQTVYLIGIVPFILGTYLTYVYITKEKSLNVYIIIGIASALFFLLWFRLIQFKIGLIFLGGFLVLLVSQYLKILLDYIEKTKFAKYLPLLFTGFIIIIIITSVVPSILLGFNKIKQSPKKETILAFTYLQTYTNQTKIILAFEDEGHLLAYYSKSKTVMDDNFLMIKNIDQRLYDIQRIYITRFSQEALELSSKYGINYIIIDDAVKNRYGLTDIAYSDDSCISKIYDNDVKIYKIICEEKI